MLELRASTARDNVEEADFVAVCVGLRLASVEGSWLAVPRPLLPVDVPLADSRSVCEGALLLEHETVAERDSVAERDAVAVEKRDAVCVSLAIVGETDGVRLCVGDRDCVRLLVALGVCVGDAPLLGDPLTDGEPDELHVAVLLGVPDGVAMPDRVPVRVPGDDRVVVGDRVCELVRVILFESDVLGVSLRETEGVALPLALELAVPEGVGDVLNVCEGVTLGVRAPDALPVGESVAEPLCVGVPLRLRVPLALGEADGEGVPVGVPVPLGDAPTERVCVGVAAEDGVPERLLVPDLVTEGVATPEAVALVLGVDRALPVPLEVGAVEGDAVVLCVRLELGVVVLVGEGVAEAVPLCVTEEVGICDPDSVPVCVGVRDELAVADGDTVVLAVELGDALGEAVAESDPLPEGDPVIEPDCDGEPERERVGDTVTEELVVGVRVPLCVRDCDPEAVGVRERDGVGVGVTGVTDKATGAHATSKMMIQRQFRLA